MSLWHLAWSYLWNRRFTTFLTIFSVALGVGLISTVLTLREETRKRFEEEGQYWDIVVGAKENSPLQLVLSTLYFLDTPMRTISWADYERLLQDEDVKAAFPIGMGDTYKNYRVVATDAAIFDFNDWGAGRSDPYVIDKGRAFEKPFEAVIGAAVAESTGLAIGGTFLTTHGFMAMAGVEHEDHPYTVVGILRRSGTPNDRAIFSDMESIWQAHAHGDDDGHEGHEEDEGHAGHEGHEGHDHEGHDHEGERKITAVLVKLESPALRFQFRDRVNIGYNAMGVIPVLEIKRLYDQVLGIAKTVLLAIGYLVAVVSSISILIGLYMAILQRKRDLAIMRALGASRGEIFGAVIIEAFWVTLLGLASGWFLGTAVCFAMGMYLTRAVGFEVSAISMTPDLVTAYSAVLLMGLLAGILPAWQAYRSDVARDLAEL